MGIGNETSDGTGLQIGVGNRTGDRTGSQTGAEDGAGDGTGSPILGIRNETRDGTGLQMGIGNRAGDGTQIAPVVGVVVAAVGADEEVVGLPATSSVMNGHQKKKRKRGTASSVQHNSRRHKH
jgi:hypothetical protein